MLRGKWWVLAAASLGVFMAILDTTSVNNALPSIVDTFHTSLANAQWVILAYLLGLSACLLPWGFVADRMGRREAFLLGYAVFVVGSLLAGLAPSVLTMALARTLQAAGAASLMSNGLAITAAAFPANERGKALGINGTITALGGVSGPVLGGLIVDTLGWRWVFFLDVLLGLLAILFASFVLQASPARSDQKKRRLDWPGILLSSASLVCAMLAFSRGSAWGWTSLSILSLFAVAALFALAFVLVERKPDPMVDLKIFRIPTFSISLLAIFMAFLGPACNNLAMPFYLQRVLGFSAGASGLLYLPLPLFVSVTSVVVGGLSDKFNRHVLGALGMTVIIGSLVSLAFLGQETPVWRACLGLGTLGFGFGLFQSSNNGVIFAAVSPERQGLMASLTNLARSLGQTMGTALATLAITMTMASAGVPSFLSADTQNNLAITTAFVDGKRNAYLIIAALAVIALAGLVLRGVWAKRDAQVSTSTSV